MRILAIDQSTKISGFSLWKNNELVNYGIITSNLEEKNAIERMKQMYDEIKKLIKKTKPDFIVFENVQFQNSYETFQTLSQMQGVLMAYLFELNLGFQIIEPSSWRSFSKIKGRKRIEQKQNAINFVKEKFQIETSEDACEAILIGLWAVNKIK